MAKQGRHLSYEKALTWRSTWSHSDQLVIAKVLAVLHEPEFIVPPNGKHIGVWVDGQLALEIKPGYLSWPALRFAVDLPPEITEKIRSDNSHAWLLLSTFQSSEHPEASPERDEKKCQRCNLVLPATGVCGYCG
jgi:hypothetical protein